MIQICNQFSNNKTEVFETKNLPFVVQNLERSLERKGLKIVSRENHCI